jgi:hypothetical protein
LSGGGVAVDCKSSASLPVAYRLYLPKDWAEDGARRDKAGVPLGIGFATKPDRRSKTRAGGRVPFPRGLSKGPRSEEGLCDSK